MVSEKNSKSAPTVTLVHRAMDSAAPSFVYTTTTVTQGTTVTIQTVAPSSSSLLPLSSPAVSVSLGHTPASMSSGLCSAGTPETVTVTVTAESEASSATSVGLFSSPAVSSSDDGAVTVMETRVTTATIFVTASGLVTPKQKTLTITATATATEFATVGANNATSGTSTSTADAVKGPSMMPSLQNHHTHFPNSTTIVPGYGTTGAGDALSSTASYTLTIPPGAGPTGTGKFTLPAGITTSQSGPVSTVVTVSGASKMADATLVLLVCIAIAAFHF